MICTVRRSGCHLRFDNQTTANCGMSATLRLQCLMAKPVSRKKKEKHTISELCSSSPVFEAILANPDDVTHPPARAALRRSPPKQKAVADRTVPNGLNRLTELRPGFLCFTTLHCVKSGFPAKISSWLSLSCRSADANHQAPSSNALCFNQLRSWSLETTWVKYIRGASQQNQKPISADKTAHRHILT